jgi:hypothetical protein
VFELDHLKRQPDALKKVHGLALSSLLF